MKFRRKQRGGEVPINFTKPKVSETSSNSAIKGSIVQQKENNSEMSELNKQVGGSGVVVPQMNQAGEEGNASITNSIKNILQGSADSEFDSQVETNSSTNPEYAGGRRKTRRRRRKSKRKKRKTKKRRKSKKRKTRKRRRKRKRRRTRKQRGSSFLKSKRFNPNKPIIMGMSEGTLERLQRADTSFGAIMKARNYIRNEGMDGLSAHRKAMGSHLKKKDILALPKYMDWQKKNGLEQQAIITSDENSSAQANRPKLTKSVGSRNLLQQAGKRRRRRA